MDTLAALVYQLGNDYAIFIPMINKVSFCFESKTKAKQKAKQKTNPSKPK